MAGKLDVGMKLHAKYTDGKFYAAQVVDISVKVRFLGCEASDDKWLPIASLKSKYLRQEDEEQAKSTEKAKPDIDYSGLDKDMQVQAESDGVWYSAKVVVVSKSKSKAKAPVKVRFIGYGADSDEWVGANRLRSKALKPKSDKSMEKPKSDKPMDKPKSDKPMDNIQRCIDRMVNGEDELDVELAPGVRIVKLSPEVTGFAAWSRDPAEYPEDVDRDRGHADWLVPEGTNNDSPRILYCHGGGYEFYSPQDVYRPCTTRLAAAAKMPVLAIDYRCCPEFRHPAQLEDAVQAFRWIAHNGPDGPCPASKIFISGDSAGGGLAFALALRLRDHPVPEARVAGVSVVSPQTDMTCTGESYTTRRWKEGGGPQCDPMFRGPDPTADSMPQIYKLLGEPGESGSYDLKDPALSVLHAELHGLPPSQIHVGDAEVMLSDSVEFAKKAVEAGSPVQVKVWPRMWHTFTQNSEGCGGKDAKPLQEAIDAIREQGEFLSGLASQP